MTVREMIAQLEACPPEAKVYFDTEAQCYSVHLVPVDKMYVLDGDNTPHGEVVVTLHEDAPRRADCKF